MNPTTSQAHHSMFIGCAGWGIPSAAQERFPGDGSHLQRYARVFPAVEINTSFYRPHRPATYCRWRDSVPDGFRFAVKMPKAITHELRLQQADARLQAFIEEAGHLGRKLGCLLVQLPPSLPYEPQIAQQFFGRLRSLTDVALVCEARHISWFTAEAAALLAQSDVSQVLADPQIAPLPAAPHKTVYIRLHGAPQMYRSPYSADYLDQLSARMKAYARSDRQVWTIFDNTLSGTYVEQAVYLMNVLEICAC